MGTKVREISPDRPDRKGHEVGCGTCPIPADRERHEDVWARAMAAPTGYRVKCPPDPRAPK